jgi:hypothetical protein
MSQLVQHSQFTQLGDYYKITVYSQVTPCEISVAGRLRSPEGEFSNFDHRINVATSGLQTIFRPSSGAWWIMSIMASVVSGTVNPGDVSVKVELTQGVAPGNQPHDLLLFGYPSNFTPASPMYPLPPARAGLVFTGTNPAAGAEISETVPAGQRWKIKFISATLLTSAVVANRFPRLQFLRAGTMYARLPAGFVIPASSSMTALWANVGATNTISSTATIAVLPDLPPVEAGDVINTSTLVLDVADDWGAPVIYYELAL